MAHDTSSDGVADELKTGLKSDGIGEGCVLNSPVDVSGYSFYTNGRRQIANGEKASGDFIVSMCPSGTDGCVIAARTALMIPSATRTTCTSCLSSTPTDFIVSSE